jgi:hypothetical protein
MPLEPHTVPPAVVSRKVRRRPEPARRTAGRLRPSKVERVRGTHGAPTAARRVKPWRESTAWLAGGVEPMKVEKEKTVALPRRTVVQFVAG